MRISVGVLAALLHGVARHAPPTLALPEPGAACPPEILSRLNINAQRAAVSFISNDAGFNCAKQLLALAEQSSAFRARSCELFVVRAPSGVKDDIVQRYQDRLTFVTDEGNVLRTAAGLETSSGARATVVVEANGDVCGTVSNDVEATAHAFYALRLLREVDERTAAEEAATRTSMDSLRELVTATATPTEEEEESAAQLEARRAAAALRKQAVRAEANRNVKFSFGRKTLAEEGARLAKVAGEALERAAANEASWREKRARAEATGDTATAEVCASEVRAAAALTIRAREDDIAAVEIIADAVEEKRVALGLRKAKEEINAAETARLAYGFRRIATQAMVGLDEANERAKMRTELEEWAARLASDQRRDERLADSYRAAVEAAWTQGTDGEGDDEARREAARAAEQWAEQLSLVDPAEMPQVREQAPTFASVTDSVTYGTAKAAVEKAESAESQALAAAVALEATIQAELDADAELDALNVRMGKKTQTVDALAAPNDEADEMRAALEVAMLRAAEAGNAED